MEVFHVFVYMCPKSSAADLLYVGKGGSRYRNIGYTDPDVTYLDVFVTRFHHKINKDLYKILK